MDIPNQSDSNQAPANQNDSPRVDARKITALVVEDNPTQATMLKMSLSRRGFDVECVYSLTQALHRLPMGGIEVILLDLSLPDSEGIQTFYDTYAAAGQTPIVVLTGLNDQNIAFEALQNGAQDYLVKGVPSDESVVRCLRYAIQRQRFETELWQSERRTRLILENAQDAFFAIDESGTIISWNTQAETLFGVMRKDALGEPLVGLIIPPVNRKNFNQEFKAFLSGQAGTIINNRVEMSLCHRDGHEFPAEVAIFAIAEGNSHMFCAFLRDVSHSKELDERIRSQLEQRLVDRMAELERSNNQLQKYNRTISEELRKPVDIICQQALSLRSQLERGGSPQSEEAIKILCQQAEKLLGLLGPNDDRETAVRHTTISRQPAPPASPQPQ